MLLGSTALTGNVDNVFLLNRTDRYAGSAIRGLNFAIVHLEIELPHQRRKPRHRLKPYGRRRALSRANVSASSASSTSTNFVASRS